jgi:hypothetical protein
LTARGRTHLQQELSSLDQIVRTGLTRLNHS